MKKVQFFIFGLMFSFLLITSYADPEVHYMPSKITCDVSHPNTCNPFPMGFRVGIMHADTPNKIETFIFETAYFNGNLLFRYSGRYDGDSLDLMSTRYDMMPDVSTIGCLWYMYGNGTGFCNNPSSPLECPYTFSWYTPSSCK